MATLASDKHLLHFSLSIMSVTCSKSVVFSGYPFSSTNKTDRHDITEIKLKVLLNTIILPHTHPSPQFLTNCVFNILWSYNAAFGIALYYTNVISNCNFLLSIFKFNIYFFLLNVLIFFGLIFCPAVSKQYIQKIV